MLPYYKFEIRAKPYCSVLNCCVLSGDNTGLSLFQFPPGEKNLERCKRWVYKLRRKGVVPEVLYNQLTQSEKRSYVSTRMLSICEQHFTADQFMNPADKGVKRIRKHVRHDAIPTLFRLSTTPTSEIEWMERSFTNADVSATKRENESSISINYDSENPDKTTTSADVTDEDFAEFFDSMFGAGAFKTASMPFVCDCHTEPKKMEPFVATAPPEASNRTTVFSNHKPTSTRPAPGRTRKLNDVEKAFMFTIRDLEEQVKRLKNELKVERMWNRRRSSKARVITKPELKEAMRPHLSEEAFAFFCAQIDNADDSREAMPLVEIKTETVVVKTEVEEEQSVYNPLNLKA